MSEIASEAELWRALHEAAARPEVDAALRDLYARVDAEVTKRGPTCWRSGKCCKFESYGHRMYVTGLEIAWFLGQGPSPEVRVPSSESEHSATEVALPQLSAGFRDACPYQVDGLCGAHGVRPLGCRVFFCEAGTEEWQHALYERFLGELRAMHERWGLPYRYMEWRAGLSDGVTNRGAG